MQANQLLTWAAIGSLGAVMSVGWFGLDPSERKVLREEAARVDRKSSEADNALIEATELREAARSIEDDNRMLKAKLQTCAMDLKGTEAENVEVNGRLVEAEAEVRKLTSLQLELQTKQDSLRQQLEEEQTRSGNESAQRRATEQQLREMATLLEDTERRQDRAEQTLERLRAQVRVCSDAGRNSEECNEHVGAILARLETAWAICVDGDFGAPLVDHTRANSTARPPKAIELGTWGRKAWWVAPCDQGLASYER